MGSSPQPPKPLYAHQALPGTLSDAQTLQNVSSDLNLVY